MEPGCLLDVVPPDARLRALTGLARVCREQNSQPVIHLVRHRRLSGLREVLSELSFTVTKREGTGFLVRQLRY